jgi:hypothetical protein
LAIIEPPIETLASFPPAEIVVARVSVPIMSRPRTTGPRSPTTRNSGVADHRAADREAREVTLHENTGCAAAGCCASHHTAADLDRTRVAIAANLNEKLAIIEPPTVTLVSIVLA